MDYSISKPVPNSDLVVVSLGAGVQSTVMTLLAARGVLTPMPDAAIFADTQWEPASVYEHLAWLETQVPFPIHRVTAGNLRANILESTEPKADGGKRFSAVPWYLADGIGRRQCTMDFKIEPIHKQVRTMLGLKTGQRAEIDTRVEQWIGISTDEIQRLKESRVKWITHRWPLMELRWNRTQCLAWFQREYPDRQLGKSACIGCPFHSDQYWVALRANSPAEWTDAVEVDRALRANGPARGMTAMQYMHRSCIPLEEVDFRRWEHQKDFGFLQECEGMCGV